MLRRSKAVTNLNEILTQAPEKDQANTLAKTIISNPHTRNGEVEDDIISYSSGTSPDQDVDYSREEHAQFLLTKQVFFRQHKLRASKPRSIPAAPVKQPSDEDLNIRGMSVFKFSQIELQMLEQAKHEKCLAEAVFGFRRNC